MVDFVPFLVRAVLLATTALSLAEEVVYSCGGFVKSPVPISYDGISVRLYTSEGNLKYESECAPNNGYYMLPVYTKGEYVLRIKPPKGWKFEPEKVELRVDGETDACSLGKDIDFHFLGFPINGQVRSGDGGLGPTDFPVRLLQHDENDANKQLKLVAQTQTVQSGSYSFAGIMPGAYVIEGGGSSDSEQEALCAARLAAKVVVKDNAVRVTDDLVISGYALGGKIMDNNTPVGGVRVLLFSGEKRKVPNCETTLPSNLSDLKAITPAGLHFICSVLSSPKNGKFTFHCVPPGAYTVLPLYKNVQSGVIFNIKPSLSSITVMSAPAEFTEAFKVVGYSVAGHVLTSQKGVPLSGAQATLKSTQSSNQFSATADKNGRYSFPSITSGKYELSVQSDDFEFPKKTVDIKPETAILQDTLPVGLQLCGRVSLDNLPGGVKRLSQRRLTLTDLKTGEAVSISTDESGKFCRMTRQGEYNLQPQLLSDERAAGVKLSPEQLRVTLLDHPVKDAVFAQVSATLSGTVTCLADCRSAKLELTEASGAEGKLVKELSLPAGQQSVPFQIEDVLPAKYELRIISDGVCWGNDRLTVTVKDEDVSGLTVTQTGYSVEVTITHDAILNWVFASNSVVHGQANVKAGQNTVCLPAAGKYELKPSACHTFEPASHAVTLGSSPVLERAQFTAVKHSVTLRIHLDQVDDSLGVRLRFGSTGEETTLSAGKPAPRQPSGFVYRVEHQCRPGQTITFVPQSKQFLFTPSELQADVEGSCLQLEPITGEKGVFFSGSISPPVAMVHVVMKHKSLEDYKLEGFSDEHGKFSLGPVRHVDQFTFSAKKDGYALEQVAGNGGHFKAMKLSELKISVMDTEGKPLESALVSLSGGPNNYRSNNLTDPATGSILFVGLSAGTYFVRSVLKEYAFEPPGMSVEVRQGITESVTLTGTRFAFSCYGHVRFLAGAGAVGTIVEAVSDACDQLHEQDTCAEDGSYRVRGLKPGCEYRLRVRSEGSAAAGTFPSFYTVQVSRSDVHDYDFSVRPTIVHMDVFGTIHLHLNEENDNDDGDVVKPTADDERVLKQCRVSVYRERRPDTPLHTAHLNWPGRMFVLRQLPIDAQNYIVRLECAPSSASGAGNAMTLRQLYDNLDSIAPEVVVRANESAKFVHLHFSYPLWRHVATHKINMSPQKAFAYFCTYALAKCQFDGSLSTLKSWDDLVMCGPDSKLLNENSVDLAEFCLFLALQHANGPGKIPFLANERHPSLTDLTNGVDDSPAAPVFDNFNETSFWNGRGSFDFPSSHRPLNLAHSEPVSRRRRSHSMDAGCSLFGDASATGHTDASLRKMAAVTEFLKKNARDLVEICAVVAQNKQLFDGDKENLDYSTFVVSKKPDIVAVDDLRPMDIIFEGCHAENFNDSLPQTETHVKKFSELVSFVVEKTGDPDQIPVLEVVQLLNIALQQSPYNHGDSDPRLSSQRPLLVCSPLKLRLQLSVK